MELQAGVMVDTKYRMNTYTCSLFEVHFRRNPDTTTDFADNAISSPHKTYTKIFTRSRLAGMLDLTVSGLFDRRSSPNQTLHVRTDVKEE